MANGTVPLEAYFRRIGYSGSAAADLQTLQALHRLHPAAIAFENLSPLLGEPVSLEPAALSNKLVERRRGGYCFEHNRLFAAVLQQLGFQVTGLAARVLWNRAAGAMPPRTHMLLDVRVGAERYLADVGFGGLTLTGPLRFRTGIEQPTPHETVRLTETGDEYLIEARLGADWRPLYRFDLQPQQPVDFEVLNHFVATHPASRFRTSLIAARAAPGVRYALENGDLTVRPREGDAERRHLVSAAELRDVLRDLFGVEAPSGSAADARLTDLVR